MLLRLLVLLIALGLSSAVVEAADLDTAIGTAFVDEAEDGPELDPCVPPVTTGDDVRARAVYPAAEQPPRYEHLRFVFRPPRAPTFN